MVRHVAFLTVLALGILGHAIAQQKTLQCSSGSKDGSSRESLKVVMEGGKIQAFSYLVNEGSYSCSFESARGDPSKQWRDDSNVSTVIMEEGTVGITMTKTSFIFDFSHVPQNYYCGMNASFPNEVTLVKGQSKCKHTSINKESTAQAQSLQREIGKTPSQATFPPDFKSSVASRSLIAPYGARVQTVATAMQQNGLEYNDNLMSISDRGAVYYVIIAYPGKLGTCDMVMYLIFSGSQQYIGAMVVPLQQFACGVSVPEFQSYTSAFRRVYGPPTGVEELNVGWGERNSLTTPLLMVQGNKFGDSGLTPLVVAGMNASRLREVMQIVPRIAR